MKLPAKVRASRVHKDVDTPHTVNTEPSACLPNANDGITMDNSKHSAFNRGSNSAAENVSKSAEITTTDRDHISDHKDIAKKPRLHTRLKESLLANPTETSHSQNIGTVNVEHIDHKSPAKVTYVGSGLMPLSSPLLCNVDQLTQLPYAFYTPLIGNAQFPNGSQLLGALSPSHTAIHLLTTTGSTAGQTLTVSDSDTKCENLSVIDTKVMENTPLAGSAQYPSRLHLMHTLSPPHIANRLQTATHSKTVPTLTEADADVCSLSSSVIDIKVADNTLMAGNAQFSSGSKSSLHTASCLSTAANSADVETLTAANADVCSEDLSVIDTEVVETAPEQFSLGHVHKQRKQKQSSKPGKCCRRCLACTSAEPDKDSCIGKTLVYSCRSSYICNFWCCHLVNASYTDILVFLIS